MSQVNARFRQLACLAAICACVLSIYSSVGSMRYVLWDDDLLIADNVLLKLDFWRAAHDMFWGFYNGDYIPLTLLSYWLEIKLAGVDAGMQHLVNLVLHLANCGLVFWWLRTQIGQRTLVLLAVAVFALHPLQVETVAWISERKGLLASFFYLIAIISAAAATSSSKHRNWFAVAYLLSFSFAAMSKANGLLIPFWLALAAFLRDRKWSFRVKAMHFLAIATAVIWSWVRVKAYASAIPQFADVMLAPERVLTWPLLVFGALGFYIRAILWPTSLSIIYPSFTQPMDWLPQIAIGFGVTVIVVITAIRSRSKELWLWWTFVLLTLAPVMNLVPRINFVNDRYAYLPIIGFVAVFSLIFTRATNKWFNRQDPNPSNLEKRFAASAWVGAALLIGGMTYASRERVMVWRDNLSLWTDTVKRVPTSSLALNNLGQAYQEDGNIDQAIKHYELSLQVADRQLANLATNNLAAILSSRAYPQYFDLQRAKSLLQQGIETVVRPDDSLVLRYNLAIVHLQMGDIIAGREVLADLLIRLQQSSNQRFQFLIAKVKELQQQTGARP